MVRSRRSFLRTSAGVGLGLASGLEEFLALSPAQAEDVQVTPDVVQLRPEIEPLVRKIEETPRDQCLAMLVEQLQRGVPYRQFLGALFLAGIRNVNPQPPGFKFHCVFVIHAAHQLSLDAPFEQRLLPLCWALDEFKASQEKDVSEGDFRLRPVDESALPTGNVLAEFHAAMEAWDQERADHAVVALVRNHGANQVIEAFWKYGARDYRNIGHKAIFVANTWRTLQTIGWQHAEPALRSLVLGVLDFGREKRVNEYSVDDQAYPGNLARAQKFAGGLPHGSLGSRMERNQGDTGFSQELLAILRSGKMDDACEMACSSLAAGKATSDSVWDASHLMAGELMMRQPGIFGIHTVTSLHALEYAFRTSASDETRLLLMLQGVGWMCQFYNFMASRSQGLAAVDITALEPGPEAPTPEASSEQILALVGTDNPQAARLALTHARRFPNDETLLSAARRLVVLKATDAHHYKYSTSILETLGTVSEPWRPQVLATAMYYLSGSTQADSPVIERAREAFRSL